MEISLKKNTSKDNNRFYFIEKISENKNQNNNLQNEIKKLIKYIKHLTIKITKNEKYCPDSIEFNHFEKNNNKFVGKTICNTNFNIILKFDFQENQNEINLDYYLKFSNKKIGFSFNSKIKFEKPKIYITPYQQIKGNNKVYLSQKRKLRFEEEDNSAKVRTLSKPQTYLHNNLNKQFEQLKINQVDEENKKYNLSLDIILNSEIGLNNENNLCYMNGVLQILFHTKPFIEIFIKEAKEKKILSNKNKYPLSTEFFYLIEKINMIAPSNDRKIIYPYVFAQKFFQLSNNFKNGEQDDSERFIRNFLEIISNELNNSFSDLFYGIIETQNYLKCGHLESTIDNSEFLDIPIPIPQQNRYFIINEYLLYKFSNETKFSSNRKCNKCNNKKIFIEKCKLIKLPIVLILTIQRLICNTYYKSNTRIIINTLLKLNNITYKLYAINIHSGTPYYGHYFS